MEHRRASFALRLQPAAEETCRNRVLTRLSERFPENAEGAYAAYAHSLPGEVSPLDVMIAVLSDELFHQPAIEIAEPRSRTNPVWSYEFSFPSIAHDGRLGASHCVELPFTFASAQRWQHAPVAVGIDSLDAIVLADRMYAAWIGFISRGNPDIDPETTWHRYEADRSLMIFDQSSGMAEDPDAGMRPMHSTLPGTKLRNR